MFRNGVVDVIREQQQQKQRKFTTIFPCRISKVPSTKMKNIPFTHKKIRALRSGKCVEAVFRSALSHNLRLSLTSCTIKIKKNYDFRINGKILLKKNLYEEKRGTDENVNILASVLRMRAAQNHDYDVSTPL